MLLAYKGDNMIIDIVLILFIALGAFMGYKKGLINVLVSFVAIIIAIVLSLLLQIPVANTLRQTAPGTDLYNNVHEGISKAVNDNKSDIDNNTIYSTIIKGIISDEQINKQSESITMFILKGLSFFIIFIIVTLIILILKKILNFVFDLPILNSVNQIGGLALGGIKSLAIVYIILAILAFISPMPSLTSGIAENINKTKITKTLYNNNLLVNIIKSNIK